MTNHIPMCPVCNQYEVGTFLGSDQFCSAVCEAEAQAEQDAYNCDYPEDGEPQGSYDLSDDGDALASAGLDRKSTRLNSSHIPLSRMPSSA